MKKCVVAGSSFGGLRLSILFLSMCIVPRWASAHDGWVEITPTIVETGQVATIALIQGNHSNEHRSYRIAGKWDQKYTTLVVVDPNGKKNALTDRLIDFGEDDEKVGPKGPKGFYIASFTPNEEGIYQTIARQVRTVQQGDGPKLLTMRIAKTAFASLNVPGVSATKNLKGFDLMSGGGDGMEIFPVTNPMGIFSGGSVTLELRLKGTPISGKIISLIRKIDGSGSVQDRTTDEKGQVNFVVGPSDSYLARVNLEIESPRPDGRSDKNSYEATYVFQVFNRP
jgi:uncharacterized GH25 family protein